MDSEFAIVVRVTHRFGGWHVRVEGEHERNITAAEALTWADLAGEEHAEAVRQVIREDADEAEARAREQRKRAHDAVIREAESTLSSKQRALERRAEANELAPDA